MQSRNPKRLYGGYMLLSTFLACFVSAGLWMVADRVEVRGFDMLASEPKAPETPIISTIDLTDIEELQPTEVAMRDNDDKILFGHQQEMDPIVPKPRLTMDKKPAVKVESQGLAAELASETPTDRPEAKFAPPTDLHSPAPRLIQIDDSSMPGPPRTGDGTYSIPRLEPSDLGGGLTASVGSKGNGVPGGNGMGQPPPISVDMRLDLPRTGAPRLPGVDTRPEPFPPVRDDVEDSDQESDLGNLDGLMTVTVRVYHEPDGGGYYEITIAANSENDRLQPIPRDVLFLIDSSASMTQDKLRLFKEALKTYLPQLAAEDRFNFVSFRSDSKLLFEEWQPPTEANLAIANSFLNRLVSMGQTDVYAGVAPFVTKPRTGDDALRPYQIFLISDGRSTVSDNLASNAFIREISRQNDSHASIFSLSAGSKTNLFLMDFLSYNNQGTSFHLFEPEKVPESGRAFISRLSQIIVANPQCTLTGELNREMYPKTLPHLYRQQPLKLYGKFPKGTDEVAIRIVGTSHGQQQEELVKVQLLKDAQPAGPELAKQWAGQKIYHLTNAWILTKDSDLRAEMFRLASDYNLVVPY